MFGSGNNNHSTTDNNIIYSLIAKGTNVLCEYTESKGNFQQISRQIIEKIPANKSTKVSYLYDQYIFHILVVGDFNLIFFCMSGKDFGSRIPFNFLEEIKNNFLEKYSLQKLNNLPNNIPNSLNKEFGSILRQQTNFYNNTKQSDKITKIKGQIEDVKETMIDNIDKVLDRGEKIDLLVNRTLDLAESADSFRTKSKELKNTMVKRTFILGLICIIVVLVLIFIVIWFGCGFPSFYRCRSTTSTTSN
ncbi:hypothetical protein ABK040_015530 [Willaertia magna]